MFEIVSQATPGSRRQDPCHCEITRSPEIATRSVDRYAAKCKGVHEYDIVKNRKENANEEIKHSRHFYIVNSEGG